MRTGFLITARLKSSRLPRKLLKPLGDDTLVGQVIRRARGIPGPDAVVLCTSTEEEDEPLAALAEASGIEIFRGDPEDVLRRLGDACAHFDLDHFVGITGENPLFAPEYARRMVEEIDRSRPDYLMVPGLPVGMAVYGARADAVRLVCRLKEEVDTEIWGMLLNQPGVFQVVEIPIDPRHRWPELRLTTDYPEDYEFMQTVFDHTTESQRADTGSLLAVLRDHPGWTAIHEHRRQAGLSEEATRRIHSFFTDRAAEIRARIANGYR